MEPIVLLGVDLLYSRNRGWIFESIGVDAQRLEFIKFWDSQGEVEIIHLMNASNISAYYNTMIQDPGVTSDTRIIYK